MISAVDLFCGCGGLSLGFQKAGVNVLAAMDNWVAALNVYQENFDHPAIQQDLQDEKAAVEIIRKIAPNMIIGGSPCQDFSSAGKRDITNGKAALTYHFANIVCTVKPTWFVMENVQRITKSHVLTEIIEQFTRNGYGLSAVILDASFCNTPQTRSRFFLIGELNGKHNALVSLLKSNLATKPMTIRDYLGDKLNLQYYYRHPRSYARRGIFSIDEPSPTIRGVNRPIPPNYQLHSGDPDNIDLATVRPLSTLERSYLQTFPESFNFFGTKTNLEQMIGNAVPVNMAAFVASVIVKYTKISHSPVLSNKEVFILPNNALHRQGG